MKFVKTRNITPDLFDTIIEDPQFDAHLPAQSDAIDKGLEEAICSSNGPRDPSILWKGHNIIVDGHRRFRVCKKHNLDYPVVEMEFADRVDVLEFMVTNQEIRRNMTPEQLMKARGVVLNHHERLRTEQQKERAAAKEKGKQYTIEPGKEAKGVRKLAEEMDVSKTSLQTARKYTKQGEALHDDVRKEWEAKPELISTPSMNRLAAMDKADQKAVWDSRKKFGSLPKALDAHELRAKGKPKSSTADAKPTNGKAATKAVAKGEESDASQQLDANPRLDEFRTLKKAYDAAGKAIRHAGDLRKAYPCENYDAAVKALYEAMGKLSAVGEEMGVDLS